MAAPRTKRTKRYATRKTLALSSIPEDSVHLESCTTTSAQQAMSCRDMMLVKCYGDDIASLKRNLVFLRKRQNVAIWLNKLFRGTLRGKVDKLEMSIVVKEGSIEHLQKLIKKTKLKAHASNLDSEGEATQDILLQHSVSCELKHMGEPQTSCPKTSGGGDSAGGSPPALAPIYPLAPQLARPPLANTIGGAASAGGSPPIAPQLARPPLASTSGGAASAGGSPPIAPQIARPPLASTSVDPFGPERQYRRPRDASLGADATKSGGSDARGLGQGKEKMEPPSGKQRSCFEEETAEACAPRWGNLSLLAWGPLAGSTLTGKCRGGKYLAKARHTLFPAFQARYHTSLTQDAVEEYCKLADRQQGHVNDSDGIAVVC
eukprot:gene26132-11852_t